MLTNVPDSIDVVATAEKAATKKTPPLLVIDTLTAYLDEQGLGTGDLYWQRLGENGTQATYEIQRDDVHFVLRREGRHALLPRAQDFETQIVLQQALMPFALGSPEILHVCKDKDVIGSVFYLTPYVEGIVLDRHPPEVLNDPEERAAITRRAVDELARYHLEIPVEAVQKFDLGYGNLRQQVLEQRRLARKARRRQIPAIDALGEYLLQKAPDPQPPAFIHGRFTLRNVVYGPKAPARIASMLGWEHATIGDPLMDLAYLTATYSGKDMEETPLDGPEVTRADHFLPRTQLPNVYRLETRMDTTNLPWYQTFVLWREAVRLEALWTRFMAGEKQYNTKFALSLRDGIPQILRNAALYSGLDDLDTRPA